MIIFSLLFISGYGINVGIEVRKKLCKNVMNPPDCTYPFNCACNAICMRRILTNYNKLPLTFDCPIAIACGAFGAGIAFLIPFIAGKPYVNCDSKTQTVLISGSDIFETNIHCAFQGFAVFISLQVMFSYMGLLSFCVFRYLQNPRNPLFGQPKIYYHIGVLLFILAIFIGSLITDMYNNLPPNALCGPTLIDPEKTTIFVLVPLSISSIFTIIFTFLSVIFTIKHTKHEAKHGTSKQMIKDLVHLSIRLMIYQVFIAIACIVFLYAITSAMIDWDAANKSLTEYIVCLALYQEPADPNGDVCSIDKALGDEIYLVQGTVSILCTVASFAVSCSLKRVKSWKIHTVTKFISSTLGSGNGGTPNENAHGLVEAGSMNSKSSSKQSRSRYGRKNGKYRNNTSTSAGEALSRSTMGSTSGHQDSMNDNYNNLNGNTLTVGAAKALNKKHKQIQIQKSRKKYTITPTPTNAPAIGMELSVRNTMVNDHDNGDSGNETDININSNKELGSPSIGEMGMGMAGSMVSITEMNINMGDSLPALTPASSDGRFIINSNSNGNTSDNDNINVINFTNMVRNVSSASNLGMLAPIANEDGIIRLESTTATRRNSIDDHEAGSDGGGDGGNNGNSGVIDAGVSDGDMSDGSQIKKVNTFTETDLDHDGSVVTGRAITNRNSAMMAIADDTGDLESKINAMGGSDIDLLRVSAVTAAIATNDAAPHDDGNGSKEVPKRKQSYQL